MTFRNSDICRLRRDRSGRTYEELGKAFGMSRSAAHAIKTGKSYAWFPCPDPDERTAD